jgi:Protein of unknown function (DUF3102)
MDTTDITTSNSLAELAARINTEHLAASRALKQGAEHAMNAGDLLIEAKVKVPHGQWLPWLAKHCDISERTAQLYMRLARARPEIEAKAQRVADLSLRGAVAALAPDETEARYAPYRVHPYANILPLMDDDELADLARDIQSWVSRGPKGGHPDGLVRPIVLAPDGKTIVDGRCRFLACKMAGIAPTFRTLDAEEYSTEQKIIAFINSANLRRQHLNSDQRAMVAARYATAPAAVRGSEENLI